MRISDCSSDVCSSDLRRFYVACSAFRAVTRGKSRWRYSVGVDPKCLLNAALKEDLVLKPVSKAISSTLISCLAGSMSTAAAFSTRYRFTKSKKWTPSCWLRSEEHTSELQSLMRISYAVFCLKKKNKT